MASGRGSLSTRTSITVFSLTRSWRRGYVIRRGTMSGVAGPAGSGTPLICSMSMPSVTERMRFRDEELEAYQWALRLARKLAEPVDYDRARDLYVSGALRLLANFEPHGIALRLAHLLETRLGEEGHAFAIASAMLDGFSRYGEVFRAYRNTSDWDLKMQPVSCCRDGWGSLLPPWRRAQQRCVLGPSQESAQYGPLEPGRRLSQALDGR